MITRRQFLKRLGGAIAGASAVALVAEAAKEGPEIVLIGELGRWDGVRFVDSDANTTSKEQKLTLADLRRIVEELEKYHERMPPVDIDGNRFYLVLDRPLSGQLEHGMLETRA